MFLPPDMQRAFKPMVGVGQRRGRVAALMGVAVEDKVLIAQGLHHVEHRFQVLVFDDGGHRGVACGLQVAGGHGQHGLADKLHGVDGQQRVAGQQRADVFQAGDVFMGDDQSHAVKGVAGRGVDAEDFGVSPIRQARVEMQLVGVFQPVVNVLGFAGHMLFGAVVFDAAAYAGCQVLREQGGEFGLGQLGLVMVRHTLSPACRKLGFAVRGRTCAAGFARSASGIPCWRENPTAV